MAGQSINFTIRGLLVKKEYEIIVVAINHFMGRSESVAAVQIVATEGTI